MLLQLTTQILVTCPICGITYHFDDDTGTPLVLVSAIHVMVHWWQEDHTQVWKSQGNTHLWKTRRERERERETETIAVTISVDI